MSKLDQGSLFDDFSAIQHSTPAKSKRINLTPLSRLAPFLERNFNRILEEYHDGRPVNGCTSELAQLENMPYYLAGLMMLGRVFPQKRS